MKISVISITKNGDKIANRIKDKLENVDIFSKVSDENFNYKSAVEDSMKNYGGVIFITSTGIAVRGIADYIESKDKDPAVVVIDNSCKFVISLLSGHLGGANDLTHKLAEILDAQPIITTATDNLGVKAPDMIAKENNLIIDNLKDAKDIAALLVDKKPVYFQDEDNEISIPKGYIKDIDKSLGAVYISNKLNIDKDINKFEKYKTLKLIRKNIVIGIGCRKDFSPEKMMYTVLKTLEKYNLDYRAIHTIATIEIKKDEQAILELRDFFKCNLEIFKADEIRKVDYKFEGSDFVYKTVGVRSVCQPCVELLNAEHLTPKLKLDGMTICLGQKSS